MSDDNKNIPPSAGEVAKAIASDDVKESSHAVQSVDPKKYENAKATIEDPYEKSSNTGWKITAVIFAIVAIGTSCACVWMALNKDEKSKCEDVATEVETKDDQAKEETTPVNEDDYYFTFYRSGLKLKLGDGFEFINYAYSSSAPYDDNWSERISVGGLSKNVNGYQNIPDFSRGRYEFGGGTQEQLKTQWTALMYLDLYEKNYWDTNIQPQIDETKANGGPAVWGNVVYTDDNYVVVYSHPQNIFSETDWEQQWEMDTTKALENAAKEASNWSK